MENIDPDMLLKKTAKPGMAGDFVVSLVIHLLLIGLTSFGLYKAWAKWGIHSPSQIKLLEKAAAKEAAKAEAQAKAEEAAKAAAEEEKKSPKKESAAAPQTSAPETKAAAAPEEPRKTPLDQEVAKPPKSFDLNEIDL